MVRDFLPDDQPIVRALILAGLRERWGDRSASTYNTDLDDLSASYPGCDLVVDEIAGTVVATGFLRPAAQHRGRILRVLALARSAVLQRVVDLAAAFASSKFAQISRIGDAQHVPVAHGIAPSIEDTPIPDSLCSVTMAAGRSVTIGDAASRAWVRDLAPVASGAGKCRGGIGPLCGLVTVWDRSVTARLEEKVHDQPKHMVRRFDS